MLEHVPTHLCILSRQRERVYRAAWKQRESASLRICIYLETHVPVSLSLCLASVSASVRDIFLRSTHYSYSHLIYTIEPCIREQQLVMKPVIHLSPHRPVDASTGEAITSRLVMTSVR